MVIPSLKQQVYLPIAVIAVFSSCSQNRVSQPVPTSEPIREVIKAIGPESWSPSPGLGTTRYLIEDSSTISISEDLSQIVPIQSSIVYSMTFASSGDSFALVGRTDSLSTSAHEHMGKRVLDTADGLEFHAILSKTGKVSNLTGDSPSICGEGINPGVTRIYDLLISYPTTRLKIGDQWVDTISTMTCRGKTTLIQKTIRQYVLTAFEKQIERKTVKIHQTSSSVFTGVSIDTRNHLNTTGSGSSETTLHVDQSTGLLIQSDGRSQTKLTINTVRGVYPFTQTLSTHIDTRP